MNLEVAYAGIFAGSPRALDLAHEKAEMLRYEGMTTTELARVLARIQGVLSARQVPSTGQLGHAISITEAWGREEAKR